MDVKNLWCDHDFVDMGWHDARMYSIVMPGEEFKLTFDIDYIFKWDVNSSKQQGFWVSPCDLVFFNVANFKMCIDFQDNILLFISDITRSNERRTPNGSLTKWDYEVECDNGIISFSATGFEQRVRKQPVLSKSQDLDKNR